MRYELDVMMVESASCGKPADSLVKGRRREQQLLQERLRSARNGQGGVLLIGGEAGIGKTALVDEIACEARIDRCLVLSGSCYDLTTTPAYGPWRELVHEYRQDPSLPKLPQSLAVWDGSTDLHTTMLRFLEDVTAVRPLVLILEDMHWSDYESVDLLRTVARRAPTLSLLFLVTYRADDMVRDSALYQLLPLLIRESRAERVDLHPLDDAAIEEIVGLNYKLEPAEQERLSAYLMKRAEGNPLFTLELLRGLEDERILTITDERWQIGDVERLQVPLLLRQLIQGRLNRLNETDRQHVAIAAVIGQEVSLALWSLIAGVEQDELIGTIEGASDARLIDSTEDGTSIRFCHALIRDALYQSILPPRRRKLHSKIGDALASYGNADADAVANHLQLAGDARAVEWLIRAGERAQRAYAWTTSSERFIKAANLLSQSGNAGERGWLLYRIGRLRRHSYPAEACDWLEQAEHLGLLAGDAYLAGYAHFDHGHVLALAGDYVHGLEKMLAADVLLDSLAEVPDDRIMAWIADSLPSETVARSDGKSLGSNLRRGTLIQWLVEAGRYQEALTLGEPYVSSLEDAQITSEQVISSLGDAWFALGRMYAVFGEPGNARAALAKALVRYRQIDHRLLIAVTVWVDLVEVVLPYHTLNIDLRRRLENSAGELFRRASGALPPRFPERFSSIEMLIFSGTWQEARPLLEAMVEPGFIIETWRHYALTWLARLAREQGDPQLAWKYLRDVLPNGAQTQPGSVTFVPACESYLLAIDLCLDSGDLEDGGMWTDALDVLIDWNGAVRWQAGIWLRRARLAQLTGEYQSAERMGHVVLEQARKHHQVLVEIKALRFLGEISAGDDSSTYLEESVALADACDARYEMALGKLSLAERYAEAGKYEGSCRIVDVLAETLKCFDAKPVLARLDGLGERLAMATQPTSQPFGLSPREIEVLRLVAQGLTDAEVADQLFISYRTVTTHLTSIFTKLGVNSRVSATRIAVESGII
jgi:DNA-binding CsgD family transcriptional regulator/tetratricopeptide (TPR) repeat protein